MAFLQVFVDIDRHHRVERLDGNGRADFPCPSRLPDLSHCMDLLDAVLFGICPAPITTMFDAPVHGAVIIPTGHQHSPFTFPKILSSAFSFCLSERRNNSAAGVLAHLIGIRFGCRNLHTIYSQRAYLIHDPN
jgi:hypothetical protein